MLDQAPGLTSGALHAIAELERLVVEADGGRLKLEWDNLRGRRSGQRSVELRGAVVGTLFLERDDEEQASIFGFVIEPSLQGRGVGRAALRQACEQLRADGACRIGLDVDVANDRALGLYTSIGFTSVTTEDCFALPLS